MINHVVAFKLKEFQPEEKTAVRNELKALLEGLKEKITELRFLEVGINHEVESKNYDLVLISHFENLEDLKSYQVHPEHQKVVKRVLETTEARAAVDFEF
ncbi:MAG TPA: stress responsive protein [Prolixibacteraceae bacterium]|nr:stress responsive protein [Prolixibacteraceae bacterium]